MKAKRKPKDVDGVEMTNPNPRPKPVRRVFGRLRGVEANDRLWCVELTKAGLRVRERCHRSVEVLDFARLCNGGRVEVTLPSGEKWSFALTGAGVEARQGRRKPKLVDWATIANLCRVQMEMFPQLAAPSAEETEK